MRLGLLLALAWPALGADISIKAPATPDLPALPAAAIPADAPAGVPEAIGLPEVGPLPDASPEAPHAAADLERLARPDAGPQAVAGFFDASRPAAPAGDADDIALPPGVVSADSHLITQASDVDRWIPDGSNSRALIGQLKKHVAEMAPYRVYRYHDAKGGFFTGIDLSRNPSLVDILPEQQSHEVKLIKKIQLYNKDLQVIVREEQKTPDIVLGGTITELKSLIGHSVDFTFLLNKANTQVYEHARRHGLGLGAAAVDLTQETSADERATLELINDWAAKKSSKAHSPSWLGKVYVFAGLDLKVFERRPDGRYAVADPSQLPLTRPVLPPVANADVHAVQLLLSKGRVTAARRKAGALQKRARVEVAGSPLAQARERVDAQRFLAAARKLIRKRRRASALALWDNFKTTHGAGAAASIEAQVRELLGSQADLFDEDELRTPRAALRSLGITGTIDVHGGAGFLPREQAKPLYDKVVARVGLKPVTPSERRELAKARQVLEESRYYEDARKLAALVARRGGGKVAVATTGRTGVAAGAGRGASEAGGASVGHNAAKAQKPFPYHTRGLSFRYHNLSALKANLRHGALAHVYFPGGFGTMEQLFETLAEPGSAPVILVGPRDYWDKTLSSLPAEDRAKLTYAQDADEAWFLISENLRSGQLS